MHVILKSNGYIASSLRGQYSPYEQGVYYPVGKHTYQYDHFYREKPMYFVIRNDKLYFDVPYNKEGTGYLDDNVVYDIDFMDNYESSQFCTLNNY